MPLAGFWSHIHTVYIWWIWTSCCCDWWPIGICHDLLLFAFLVWQKMTRNGEWLLRKSIIINFVPGNLSLLHRTPLQLRKSRLIFFERYPFQHCQCKCVATTLWWLLAWEVFFPITGLKGRLVICEMLQDFITTSSVFWTLVMKISSSCAKLRCSSFAFAMC